MLTGYNTA